MSVSMVLREFRPKLISDALGRRLHQTLERHGYLDIIASLRHGAESQLLLGPLHDHFGPTIETMLSLFQFGNAVAVRDIPTDLAECLRDLTPSGLCKVSEETIRLPGLALTSIDGILYFYDLPTGKQTLYFGTDSWALSTRLQLPATCIGIQILDLCAGPGIQGLLSARYGAHVTSVEINPIAADLCRCNVRLNGLCSRISVVNQDLTFFLNSTNSKYDYIFANPPLLPIPTGYRYPFVGDGGPSGLEITKRIIEFGIPVLQEGGRLSCIGISGGSNSRSWISDLAEKIVSEYNVSCNLVILAKDAICPSSMWVNSLITSLELYSGTPGPDSHELSSAYHVAGCDSVYSYALSVMNIDQANQCNTVSFVDSSMSGLTWWCE